MFILSEKSFMGKAIGAGLLAAFFALAIPASAQIAQREVEELEGVGITEMPGAQLPLDAEFTDENGNKVTLGKYFTGEKPVILTLVYFECPMLCTLVVNGAVDALQKIKWMPGREFEMLTVSFNPAETPILSKLKKQNYIKMYGRPDAARGWHFLTGREKDIKALTEAVGFGYKWNEKRKEYAHSAAIIVITPDGKVSRYIYGVMYDPNTVRMSLLEAGEGKIGTPLDKVMLYCFHFDASEGKYTMHATNVMRLGALVTLFALGTTMSGVWAFARIRRRDAGKAHPGDGEIEAEESNE